MYLSYLLKGISLANKHLPLLSIFILLNIPLYIVGQEGIPESIGILLVLLGIVAYFFSFSLSYCLPIFLAEKKSYEYKQVFNTVLKTIKRLLLPGLVLLILFLGIGIIYGVFILIIKNDFIHRILFALIIGIVSPIFLFSPLYFSLEKAGFVDSLLKSIRFNMKHISYALLLCLLNIGIYFLTSLLPLNLFGQFLNAIIYSYTYYILLASALFYFQNHNKK